MPYTTGEPLLDWGILFLVAVVLLWIIRKLAKIGCMIVLLIIAALALLATFAYIKSV